jgi:hypothetical protein
VRTENAARFQAAMALRANRGAAEAGLVVVHGRAGDGKSRTLDNWASACNAAMLTANPSWTVRRMMLALAEKLSIPARGDWEAAIETAIGNDETPVVVDEAGFALADNAACLERLRAITDHGGTLLVMVVMERDMARLRQYDQLTSRATLCPFHPSTLADIRAACAQLAEVEIADDLAARIHRDSGARMRLVVEAIHTVEAVARGAGKARVAAADLGGIALCEDFNRALREPRGSGKAAA